MAPPNLTPDCSTKFDENAVVIGSFEGPVWGLHSAVVDTDQVIIIVEGQSTAAGELHNAEATTKPVSTGREYGAAPIRTMGKWYSPQRNSIFAAVINQANSTDLSKLSMTKPVNVLKGTGLQKHRHGELSVSKYGVTLVCEDFFPRRNDYFDSVVVFTSSLSVAEGSPDTIRYPVPDTMGLATSPRVSSNGKHLVFLQKRTNWFDDMQSQVVLVSNIQDPQTAVVIPTWLDASGMFTRTPDTISWSDDCTSFFLIAAFEGHKYLYKMPAQTSKSVVEPEKWSEVEGTGSVTIIPGSDGLLLETSSRMLEPQTWTILHQNQTKAETLWKMEIPISTSCSSGMPGYFEIHFPGAGGNNVHAWIMTPSGFDPSVKYPVMLCIHGGPECAWNDTWVNDMGACWNFPLFAEQGYIVVCPNITGSSGFGEDFCSRVKGKTNDDPFIDLCKLMEYMENEMHYVDMNRAVALGLSFGGYMVNWIHSNPLGRKFKALVCESGLFNLSNLFAPDVMLAPRLFGGEQAALERFNPAMHLEQWHTPTLFIVGEQDFRVVSTEGISAFHFLQDRGVESRILSYPDEGHITEKPANRLQWWNNVLGWCNKYTNNVGEGKVVLSYPNMDPDTP